MYKIVDYFPGFVHYHQGSRLYGSIKNKIYHSEDGGKSWNRLVVLPVSLKWQMSGAAKLGERLLRGGVRHMCSLSNSLIILGYGKIYCYNLESSSLISVNKFIGSRPFALCVGNSRIYYGEYWGNPKRKPISVFCSGDCGLSWEEVFQFSGVRHIHGVFYDSYTGYIWVTTGDEDQESAIWVTVDNFKTVRKVLGGSQDFRAVTLLFTREYVYFGSDTGRKVNHIYRYRKQDALLEQLQRVGSSVFYGFKEGGNLFFSTVCEPSKVNETECLAIWYSENGGQWEPLLKLHKDIWPKKLFQYGYVFFPAGQGRDRELWANAVALKEFGGSFLMRKG
jgi:hypothetical protein